MKQFSLDKWLENPSRKVVTRDGRPVRIVCWDAPTKNPIYGFVEGDDGITSWRKDGRFSNLIDNVDLFFTDEEELIDSLPEESDCEVNCTTKSEDLEEEIKSWIPTHLKGGNEYLREAIIEWSEIVARHFAKWQKKKDQETIELAEDHAMLAGMMKEREELMKDAVDAAVHKDLYSKYIKEQDKDAFDKALVNFKDGDKVKIIIVKEEQ